MISLVLLALACDSPEPAPPPPPTPPEPEEALTAGGDRLAHAEGDRPVDRRGRDP